MIDFINFAILIGSGLIVLSAFTSLISFRIGVPLLLVFLAIGLAAGEDGIGRIIFTDAPAAFFVGSMALAVILFDSGFGTRLQSYRIAAWPALILATAGVLLTAAMIAAVAHFAFGFGMLEGLLLGAIVASTDAAAVFFLLRVGGITIRDRVRSTLEIESGSNDPMAIFLTLTLIDLITGHTALSWQIAASLAWQMGAGGLLGVLGGWGIVLAVNRLRLETGLTAVVVLGAALLIFSGTGTLGGSGFLAVYVAGLVAGNARLHSAQGLRRFQSAMTWLSQIVMFLTLGLLATPSHFPAVAVPALTLAIVLIFVARPVAVWLCLLPFDFSRNEVTFIAWVGLRGAVSILLAIVPVLGGLPNGQAFFNIAFIVVLVSLLVQGWSIRPMARWLGLIVPPRTGPIERMQLDLPGHPEHELVAYTVHPSSPVARGQRVPRWARPALVMRDDRVLTGFEAARIMGGDQVYVFARPWQVPLLDRLFAGTREVTEEDRDFFGDFVIDPEVRVDALAEQYGQPLPKGRATLTVAELFEQEFHDNVDVGDRLRFGAIELIVRDMDEGRITRIGLALEPTPTSRNRLPLFQSRAEILAAARRLWRRLTVRRPESPRGAAGRGNGRPALPGRPAGAAGAEPPAPGSNPPPPPGTPARVPEDSGDFRDQTQGPLPLRSDRREE